MRVRGNYTLAVIAGSVLLLAACSAGTQPGTSGATAPARTSTAAAPAKTSAQAAATAASGQAQSGRSSAATLVRASSKQAPAADIKLQAGQRAGVGKPLYSRGFNIWNLTSCPQTLTSVTGASPEGRPPDGHVIQPGAYDHYEITWWFLKDQDVNVSYIGCGRIAYTAYMAVAGDGTLITACNPTQEKAGQCSSSESSYPPTIVFLDRPGTVVTIPPSQGQSQKDTLYQLCAADADATCAFTATGEQQTFGNKNVVGAVNPNDTQDDLDVDDTCSYTAGISDTWGGEVKVGVEKIVTVEVSVSYHHEVSNETTFEHRVRYVVRPGDVGWTTISWPVYRDTGNFTITMGHTTWHLDGVYFDIPYTDSLHVPTWDSHTAPKGDPSIPPHAKSATPANGCTPSA